MTNASFIHKSLAPLLGLGLLSLSLGACSSSDDGDPSKNPGSEQGDRVKLGKADSLAGSCQTPEQNYCGTKSAAACWCDDLCQSFGDCCVDYLTACTSPSCPDPNDPKVHYVNDSYKKPLACTNILFACEPGQTAFSDECGCGCIDEAAPQCPDPQDPSVHYVADSYQAPEKCANILFACETGQTPFSNDCGCGCIDAPAPPTCPDPNDPNVKYMAGSENDPAKCLNILFACDPGEQMFSNDCGCGCIAEPAPACPDASDPKTTYVNGSENDPAKCLNILFACKPGEQMFSNDCGCGCIAP